MILTAIISRVVFKSPSECEFETTRDIEQIIICDKGEGRLS